MPTIDENRQRWNSYDWTESGDEWSAVWGGTEYLWWGAIYPRIQHLLPVPVILEIAPGFGRFSQFLKSFCDELYLIDLSERCIEGCRERFRHESHLKYFVGDGTSLSPIPDDHIDFVFSFDSLVHCENEVIDGYLEDLPGKMTPQGTGFIHHSNFAALIDPRTGKADCANEHWRATSVSADYFARACRKGGLVCSTQELVNWGGTRDLTDSLSIVSMPQAPIGNSPYRRRENPDFMAEALSLGRVATFAASTQVDSTGAGSTESAPKPDREISATPDPEIRSISAFAEYRDWTSRHQDELSQRRQRESQMMTPTSQQFAVPGRCYVCDAPRNFKVTWDYAFELDGVLTPNWREQLLCPACGLNGRMRATVHLLETRLAASLESHTYITEQTSPLFRTLSDRHPGIVGSEFLRDGTPPGQTSQDGFRHEDLARLSFSDETFSLVVSLDVLEHMPAYEEALAEAHRVLKPGGSFFFSAPFQPESPTNLTRARLQPDGSIEHLQPPEYHYDPLDKKGVLAFHLFGWELLQATRDAGFSDVDAHFCHSFEYGYFGPFHVYFQATRT